MNRVRHSSPCLVPFFQTTTTFPFYNSCPKYWYSLLFTHITTTQLAIKLKKLLKLRVLSKLEVRKSQGSLNKE